MEQSTAQLMADELARGKAKQADGEVIYNAQVHAAMEYIEGATLMLEIAKGEGRISAKGEALLEKMREADEARYQLRLEVEAA